jgi:hypothetical protein
MSKADAGLDSDYNEKKKMEYTETNFDSICVR